MKNLFLSLLAIFIFSSGYSQELYVYSEPASNMPAKSASLKLTGRFPQGGSFKQRYMPEVMLGVNRNWMVHLSTTLSNYYSANIRFEGGKVYAKYRFYSSDGVHSHFRMAAFADVAYSRNELMFEDVNFEGDNKGYQAGLIATQLVNKLAVSATAAYGKVFQTEKSHSFHGDPTLSVLNYSLSAGYLVLPKEYTNYKQTNVNVYLELLGMRSLDQKHYSVDLAPALQFIFNSNSKINIGYKFQVAGNMSRIANRTIQVAFEHTLFNVWK